VRGAEALRQQARLARDARVDPSSTAQTVRIRTLWQGRRQPAEFHGAETMELIAFALVIVAVLVQIFWPIVNPPSAPRSISPLPFGEAG